MKNIKATNNNEQTNADKKVQSKKDFKYYWNEIIRALIATK
jgi:hypothetical protein